MKVALHTLLAMVSALQVLLVEISMASARLGVSFPVQNRNFLLVLHQVVESPLQVLVKAQTVKV